MTTVTEVKKDAALNAMIISEHLEHLASVNSVPGRYGIPKIDKLQEEQGARARRHHILSLAMGIESHTRNHPGQLQRICDVSRGGRCWDYEILPQVCDIIFAENLHWSPSVIAMAFDQVEADIVASA